MANTFATSIIQTRVQISVRDLYKRLQSKQFSMNPAYQRDYIANSNKPWQQNLISNIVKGESVIPYLYIRTRQGFNLNQFKHFNGHLLNPVDDEQKLAREQIIDALTEVIDGQQRSRTIQDFINDLFNLPEQFELQLLPKENWGGLTPTPLKLSGLTLSEVKDKHPDIYDKFMEYQFTVVATMGTEEAIHQMFCDLNDLNKMSNQEKRNANTCELAGFVRDTARLGINYDFHSIFSKVDNTGLYLNFPFKRMGQDEILAKVISIVDGSAFSYGLNKTSLDNLYKKDIYQANIPKSLQEKLKKVLDACFSMVKSKEATKTMNAGAFLNLVMVVNELISNSGVKVKHWGKVWNWFLKAHIRLGKLTDAEKAIGLNETIYHQKTRLGQDSDGLDMRLTILKKNGLYENSGVQLVDRKRVISDNEFEWMWIMADKKCTVPDDEGKICDTSLQLEDAVKAHKIAHSNGGKTTVENTYVACKECNKLKIKDEPNWVIDD